MKESELRDLLTKDITVLGKGLILLDKEHYVPNELGTRSFIDLYAKDQYGHHVLIELKRSETSSREAIHEIYKYVEGVKTHLGVRDHEIVVIIALTEWRELLVPFSRFVTDTTISVQGLNLSIEDNKEKIIASPIQTLPVTIGRFIAPWHEVFWYSNKQELDKGLDTIHECYKIKGVKDYICLILKPTIPISSEHETNMIAALMSLANIQDIKLNPEATNPPKYEFAIYVAMQIQSEEQYIKLLQKFPTEYEEVLEYLSDESDEERIFQLHEALDGAKPRPKSENFEIGYPAKLNKFLDEQGIDVIDIIRQGLFQRNQMLTDKAILAELCGKDGVTGQRYNKSIKMDNTAHVTTAKQELTSCLEMNFAWKNQILRIFEEIEYEFPTAEVEISIYNPQTALFTMYFSVSREDGFLFVPNYSITVKTPNPVRMYYGSLQAEERTLSFRKLLKKYYDNDLGQLLITMTWGGRENRDIDILEDAGAFYRSFRCDILDVERRRFFTYRDERWRETEEKYIDPISLWNQYLAKNEGFIYELVNKIEPCFHDGIFEHINTSIYIKENTDYSLAQKNKIYYSDNAEYCEICGCTLSEEAYMANIPNGNDEIPNIICIDCLIAYNIFKEFKIKIFENSSDGWLQVGGF